MAYFYISQLYQFGFSALIFVGEIKQPYSSVRCGIYRDTNSLWRLICIIYKRSKNSKIYIESKVLPLLNKGFSLRQIYHDQYV